MGALLFGALVSAQSVDPLPYDSIANPLSKLPATDTSVQGASDLKNMVLSPLRVNQAGYRLVDVQDGLANFYFIGNAPPLFTVKTLDGASVGTGTFVSKGVTTTGSVKADRVVSAERSPNLMMKGYPKTSNTSSGTVYEGILPPTLPAGKYVIEVGANKSAPFVVSPNLYGMVRDATLKFYGIQRSGTLADETGLPVDTLYSPSWFRSKPSHVWDGWLFDTAGTGAAKYKYKGALSGGWYDCGDHLKETRTQSFALAMLGILASTMPQKDADHYGFNHKDTRRTDGVPDMVRELKWGSNFAIKAWKLAGGSAMQPSNLRLSVGDFKDHEWWGQPQFQDAVGPDRGGKRIRTTRKDWGSGSLADWAAGLAFASRLWRPYDRTGWSDTALQASKAFYALAKSTNALESTPAYSGETKTNDDLGLAATALLWATGEKSYLSEIVYTTGLPSGAGGVCGGSQEGDFPASNLI